MYTQISTHLKKTTTQHLAPQPTTEEHEKVKSPFLTGGNFPQVYLLLDLPVSIVSPAEITYIRPNKIPVVAIQKGKNSRSSVPMVNHCPLGSNMKLNLSVTTPLLTTPDGKNTGVLSLRSVLPPINKGSMGATWCLCHYVLVCVET